MWDSNDFYEFVAFLIYRKTVTETIQLLVFTEETLKMYYDTDIIT